MNKLEKGCRKTEKKQNPQKTVSNFKNKPKPVKESVNERFVMNRSKENNIVFLKKFMSGENVDSNIREYQTKQVPVRETKGSGSNVINTFQFKDRGTREKDKMMSYIDRTSRNETVDDLNEYSEVKKASPNKESRYPNLRIFNQKSPLDFNAKDMLHLK